MRPRPEKARLVSIHTRTSTGLPGAVQSASCASVPAEMPLAIPLTIPIAWFDVVESDALTMSSARTGAPRCVSFPKSRSITSPAIACAESIAVRIWAYESTRPMMSK